MTKEDAQLVMCRKYNAHYVPSSDNLKLGIAQNVKVGTRPIHGVRYQPENGTAGWYIWAGEYSPADDFFLSLHIAHVGEWEPSITPYLELGPGWRFLLMPEEGYEDVWYDADIL